MYKKVHSSKPTAISGRIFYTYNGILYNEKAKTTITQ